MYFSSKIWVDGAIAGTVAVAEGAGDPGAVTKSASSLDNPKFYLCAHNY